MRIAVELLDQIVEHARRDAPDECCGMAGVRDDAVVSVHAMANAEASPFRFNMDAVELLRVNQALEDAGESPGLIYHSHTRSAPEPSQTDIQFAGHWPGWRWLIVGLKGPEPEVRLWSIEDGEVREVRVVPG